MRVARNGHLCTRLLLAAAALLASQGCDPFRTGSEDLEPARYYRATRANESPPLGGPLRVMNYNVKFGGGRIDFFFDCHGDRVLMTEAEVRANLAALAEKINDYDPPSIASARGRRSRSARAWRRPSTPSVGACTRCRLPTFASGSELVGQPRARRARTRRRT